MTRHTPHTPDPDAAPRNPDPLLTMQAAGEYAGVSAVFVRREIAAGRLEGTNLGRLIRVRLSDLEAYLRDQRTP